MKANLKNNKKIYSSYEEIDHDLAILKLEKEIHLRKISVHLQKTGKALSPNLLISEAVSSFTEGYSGILKKIAGFIVVALIKRFLSRRG